MVEAASIDIALARAPERRRAGRRAARLAWACLAPSLVFLALFTYWPVALVTIQSFALTQRGESGGFGLGNFARLFADPHFFTAVVNNLIYAVGTIGPSLVLALAFALALQSQTRINAALRALIVAPQLIPLVAAASLFSFIYLPGGGLIKVSAGEPARDVVHRCHAMKKG